ncbi:MAG TPA: Crp/Fnr family transcriptional regulator [Acidimicrobiia bacterium]
MRAPTGPLDPFWAALGDDDRAALLEAGRARNHPRGGVVFRQGDGSDSVVVVLDGRVKIVAVAEDGTETVLSVRGPGSLVGELGAADGSARLATVVALDPLRTRVLTSDEFLAYVGERSTAALALLRSLVGRLREADRRRIEFGAYDATRRVAHLLADLADARAAEPGRPVEIELSQQELAAMIGSSRESVSRALAVLRDRKIITTARRTITVLQPDELDSA